MEFRILGAIELHVDSAPVGVNTTKARGLLGVLLFYANKSIPVSKLAEALWDDGPAQDAAKALQPTVSRLRRVLNSKAIPVELVSVRNGYRLDVDLAAVDYHRFRSLVRRGNAAAAQGDHTDAANNLATAIGLWRGTALADLTTAWARRLQDMLVEQELLPAYCALFDAKLVLGDIVFVIDRLPPLLSEYPYAEQLAAIWLRVLRTAGRLAEAGSFYRQFCQRLANELDTEPGPELTRCFESLSRPHGPSPGLAVRKVRPDLPRSTGYFTGRTTLLANLAAEFQRHTEPPVMVALDGPPGIGKSTLVGHWARQVADRYPNGVAYLNLHGHSSYAPVEPASAITMLLDQLGEPAPPTLPGVATQAALVRQALDGRRILVILDNARDSRHVEPVLDAVASCPVLVTSRHHLPALAVRYGAVQFTVPALSADEAAALLTRRIGARAEQDPAAVAKLVELCAALPLALRLVGEHVAARPAVPLAELADELSKNRRLLDTGGHGDDRNNTLRSTFSWSVRALTAPAAQLFKLLGGHPGTRFSEHAVAAICGVPVGDIHQTLDELIGAHLVEQEQERRYHMHGLLHDYAADSATRDEPDLLRQAIRRMLDWYVESVRTARDLVAGDDHPVDPLPEPLVEPMPFAGPDEALRWCVLERTNLVAVTRLAAAESCHAHVWRLVGCLHHLLRRYGDLAELAELGELGRRSAALLGDLRAEAGCTSNLGEVFGRQRAYDRALRCTERALTLFQQAGDVHGQAVALNNVGSVHLERGDPATAITFYERSLGLSTRLDNSWAIAHNHRRIGDAYRALDRLVDAAGHYYLSLTISRQSGDQRRQAQTLAQISQLQCDQGRADLAVESCRSAIELQKRTLDKANLAGTWCILASALIELRSFKQAAVQAEQAAGVYREMNDLTGQARAWELAARAREQAGEPALASDRWTRAARVLRIQQDQRAADLERRAADLEPPRGIPNPRGGADRSEYRLPPPVDPLPEPTRDG